MPVVSELSAVRVHIDGLVQGVGFRWSAQSRAADLGISGWCRNLIGGRVEFFAQGRPDDLQVFLTWLHDGPTASVINEVHVVPAAPDPRFVSFEIR
ncbi:MAG: acylphosphatase [Acidimicrobiia bacterium]